MNRDFFFKMAKQGMRFPIATHLVLHEEADPASVLRDGSRLAEVMRRAAARFSCPLALPVMDLSLEKDCLLAAFGVPAAERALWHCHSPADAQRLAELTASLRPLDNPLIRANCEALGILAADLGPNGSEEADGPPIPVGMCIGPFSLVTKLLDDPITPVYLAGSGLRPEDSEEVAMLEALLPAAEAVIGASVKAQLEAGARAVFVCEPAANLVYFSPNQLREGSPIFSRLVVEPNLRLRDLIVAHGAELLFHDCGELVPEMIEAFAPLNPALISLGSSVRLWEAEPLIPATTVMYGNLPSKKFYSDEELPLHRIEALATEIELHMAATGHAFILGSECDILAMEGYADLIRGKVEAVYSASSPACACGFHGERASPMIEASRA
jgi:hypothetical protein